MRRRVLAVAALMLAAACGVADDSSITEPALQRPLVAAPSVGGASCPAGLTFAGVRALMLAVYADGSPDENSARGKFDNIEHHYNQGNVTTYRNKAWDLAGFTIDNRDAGKLVGSQAAINEFLNGLFCLVGLGPYFTGNSFFIYPSDNSQILETTDGLAGVNVPANNVTEPTLLTITPLTVPPVFDTKLDVYPFFYQFEITNAGGTGWVNPIIVGVCPPSNLDPDVKANLLLGHQDGTTFEILPEADASFLDCSAAGGSGNLVVTGDSTLVGAAVIGSSGVGGSTDDFSPIAPVDGRVVGSAGAGGAADDFRPRRGMTPSMNLVSLPSVSCSPITALIGAEVDPACRPIITFATPTQHTPIQGVNVAWSVESGAGSIATPSSCSPFSSSFTQATDANGVTTVCWKLGTTPGTNTVTATASPGGEAPDGVTFVYSEGGTLDPGAIKIRFTATAIKLDPVVGATGGNFPYSGSPQAGSGTCSPLSLTPVLTYNTQNGQAPVEVGTYTLTVTCGEAGDPGDIYSTKTATASITIGQASSTTSITCPASVPFNGQAQTPCTVAVTGDGGLNMTVNITYTNNTNAGTATADASYGGDANHTSSSDSETFAISQVASVTSITCPASVPFNGQAQTPCSAAVTGVGGLNTTVTVSYLNNTNAGTATADASYGGDTNHTSSSDSETFAISQVASITTITCPASVPFNGQAQTPCSAAVTGVGGLNTTVTVSYLNNTNAGTATADASYGGDTNHTSSSDSETFAIDPVASVTTIACSPTSVPYNGSAQAPCGFTATVTGIGGLSTTTAVTYVNNMNAGTATANASYGGDANHTISSDSKTFTITQASSTTVVNCPISVPFTGQPRTPCTATVTGVGGLNTTVTVTYSNNTLIGTASASATYAGDVNHTGSSGSATFIINNGYVQVGCFASPVFSVMPSTKSAQNKGSNLPVKCTLKWPNGTAVTNATGSLLLWDLGTGAVDGSTPQPGGAPGHTIANAFSPTSNGNYSHQLNTNPPSNPTFFASSHAYYIKAIWSDGSTTTGYFRIK